MTFQKFAQQINFYLKKYIFSKPRKSLNVETYNNNVVITCFLKKEYENLRFWSTQFFRSLSISKNSLQTPSSEDIFAGNFTWSNSIILIENLIRWKRGLKYFWFTTMQVIFEIKISLVRNKKYLYQCHSPYTMQVSHAICYMHNSLFHVIYVLSWK